MENAYIGPVIGAVSQLSEKLQVKLLTELDSVIWEFPRKWAKDVYAGIFSLVSALSPRSQEQLLAEFMKKIDAIGQGPDNIPFEGILDAIRERPRNSLFEDIYVAILRLDKERQKPLLRLLATRATMLETKNDSKNAASRIAGALARLE